jgi:hypothetical protein
MNRVNRKRSKKYLSLYVVAPIFLGSILLFAGAVSSISYKGPFGIADTFPRGALVYAQFKDLPTLIKSWNESSIKEKYLNSDNFDQLKRGHLLLKLIERWEALNSSLGFTLDLAAISDSSEQKVGLGIYDIGRLNLLFIAPLSNEKLLASKFIQNKEHFEEIELSDGIKYYRVEIESNNGEDNQTIVFAALNQSLIVATNEELLLRTLSNINGTSKNDRLSQDGAFNKLTKLITPHLITVWVDQEKLNNDWYFKHYWIGRNIKDLKSIRAGIFDFEKHADHWIEHREFLYKDRMENRSSKIGTEDIDRIMKFIPSNAPYFKIYDLMNKEEEVVNSLQSTLFENVEIKNRSERKSWNWNYYDDSDFAVESCEDEYQYGYSCYSSLNYKFNLTIDDPDDAGIKGDKDAEYNDFLIDTRKNLISDLDLIFKRTDIKHTAKVVSPKANGGPLFVEFRKAAILSMKSSASFDSQAFENALSSFAKAQLTINGSIAEFNWSTKELNGTDWRQLDLPMLGREICYKYMDQELIVTNSNGLIKEMLSLNKSNSLKNYSDTNIHDVTVIRFNQREEAFDKVVKVLNEREEDAESSQDFFSDNISSLLDVVSQVDEVQIERSKYVDRLSEKIVVKLKG